MSNQSDKGKAVCQWYRKCSGCDFMHEPYPRQLNLKHTWIHDALKPFGLSKDSLTFTPAKAALAYRSSVKLCLHEAKPAPRKIGLYGMGTKDVIAIPGCPVQDSAINKLLQKLFPLGEPPITFYDHSNKKWQADRLKFVTIRQSPSGENFGVILSHTGVDQIRLRAWWQRLGLGDNVSLYSCELNPADRDLVLGSNYQHIAGPETLSLQIGIATFSLTPMSFFQANRQLLEEFVAEAVSFCAASTKAAGLLDLYGGFGAYSAQLLQKFSQVHIVDGNVAAIAAAKKYFLRIGAKHVYAEESFVESFLKKLMPTEKQQITHIISNPPRAGMSPQVIESFAAKYFPQLQNLTIVSCSLESLRSNLQLLHRIRPFEIVKVRGFDMFPQTRHVETICHLRFKS